MRNLKSGALALLAAATLASASDVHDLKKDTFNEFVQENDLVLAECMSLSVPFERIPMLTSIALQSLRYCLILSLYSSLHLY